jgi:hypothetical protein
VKKVRGIIGDFIYPIEFLVATRHSSPVEPFRSFKGPHKRRDHVPPYRAIQTHHYYKIMPSRPSPS